MDARLKGGFLSLAAVLVAAGCIISQDELAGRACSFDADCPESYACVGPEGLRSCEVLYPPSPGTSPDAGTPDSGTPDSGTPDAGVVPTYCNEVQPLLAAYCVSSCHGAVTTGSGQTGFRLDYYDPDTAGQPKGAREMAPRIKARAFDQRTMPIGNPKPTDAERAILARWAIAGAPLCGDGGTP